MKKLLYGLIVMALFFFFALPFMNAHLYVQAQATSSDTTDLPIICGCPPELSKIYQEKNTGEKCVVDYNTFKEDPASNHLWVEDAEITAQGKADDRARQFFYWVVSHSSIDSYPTILKVWSTARNVAYFFVLIVAAIMGVGMIISQRSNFSSRIKLWPSIMKLLAILLFISFSASIVLTIIQLSDVLMKFFIENLGGKDLFNIYFGSASTEANYLNIVGCRDLNIRVQESVHAEMFLLKITNVTYYVMGGMLILRKVLLWFLLILSPFLAILAPFVFIRNIGWIWIGVFFQWIFYGPLFALFLGALATIWKSGIPYTFDFSRVNKASGYIYPTAMNVLYGGPAQTQSITNNGNYVDTFTEYVISLIMQWAVIFFPWWLLRIFRDYCCDGIYAMKNILMSMYDQSRGTPPKPPGPVPTPANIGVAMNIPQNITIPMKVKIETIEEIKKAKTEEITRSLDVSASKLADIAHYETDKQKRETVNKNLNFLKNPTLAETQTDRQKYMNIRTELFSRSIKEDHVAQRILSSISTSKMEQLQRREELLKTVPKMIPVTHVVSIKVKLPQEKVQSVTASLSSNPEVVQAVAMKTQLQQTQVQTVLSSLAQQVSQPSANVVQKITEQSGLSKDKVKTVLQTFSDTVKSDKKLEQSVADKEQLDVKKVEDIIATQAPVIEEPEQHIEQTVAIPPSISLEDYEQVKKMWVQQYEKGEVPLTENIKTREQWVEQDAIFITNTLNKLLSPNEELRQEGLDEVGYILPIFYINNLKGEELIVYLKAKLEAAKQVKDMKEKEKEITEKVKSKEKEELVEVSRPKEEHAEKTMTMVESMKLEDQEQKKPEPETEEKNTDVPHTKPVEQSVKKES